jgi:hypothetical protein
LHSPSLPWPFNIGYFALNGFMPAKEVANSMAAAMTLVANTDALIIDLRKNGGGAASTSMFVPSGRSMNPVTKLDWEGAGVAPDVSTSADDAMKTAQIAILKKIAGAAP